MSVDPKEVVEKIDADELIKVTLDLANIDSPTGSEGPVADYVYGPDRPDPDISLRIRSRN